MKNPLTREKLRSVLMTYVTTTALLVLQQQFGEAFDKNAQREHGGRAFVLEHLQDMLTPRGAVGRGVGEAVVTNRALASESWVE